MPRMFRTICDQTGALALRFLICGTFVAALLLAIDAEARPQETPAAAVPAGRQANHIAIISIHGPIDGITTRSLDRRLDEAARRGIDAVILEIDTPGGDLMATFDILELIRTKAPANTIAWVRPKAFSAGTIIALACREIVTTPTGRFGDAAPIQGMPLVGLRNMPAAERAKIEAPLLSELVYDARRQGWDEKLVQAFVAVDVQLWLIRHRDTGDLLFVDAAEYERIFGEAPISTRLERLPAPAYQDERTFSSPTFKSDVPTPPATIPDAETVEDARQAAIDFRQETPSRRPQLDRGDADDWESLGQIISADELLVLRADEAVAYGLSSSDRIGTDADLQSFMGATTVTRLDETWSEGLVRFLTLWPVRVVLIVVMLVGFFIELSAPGYGVFGLVAVSSLAVLLGAPLLAGLSDWWTVIVVLLGLALVVAELFFLPGFGVAGMLGGLLLFAGLVGTFVSGDPFDPAMRDQLFRGIAATMIAGLAASSIGWVFWRTLPNNPFASRIILGAEIGDAAHDLSSSNKAELIEIGTLGITATPLRTAGRVEFDGRLVDAQSEDGFIEQGTRVRVIASDRFGVRVEIDRA
jgi:membrane-bound serine protease (ClpP class)